MTLQLPDGYAETGDLESYWRPLTSAEQSRARTLLGWAAKLIKEQPGAASFDVLTCAQVSMDMVKRAMIATANGDGVSETTGTQTMDVLAATTTNKYVNPVGNLYLTAGESNRLAGRPNGGSSASVTLKSNVRVPGQPWNHQGSAQVDATD